MKMDSLFRNFSRSLVLLFATSLSSAQVSDTTTAKSRYESYLKFHMLVQDLYLVPHWYTDGDRFWFATGSPENTQIFLVDPKKNTKIAFFDAERLRNALKPFLSQEFKNKGIPFSDFSFVNGNDSVQFEIEEKKFKLSLKDYKILPVKADSRNRESKPKLLFSPTKKWFADIKENNVWLTNAENKSAEQLTFDGAEFYTWNTTPNSWSTDGNTFIATRSDGRKVHHLPVIDYAKPLEEVNYSIYAKTGETIEIPELFAFDVQSKKQIKIDVGAESQQYVFPLEWTPDGSEFLFMRLSRLGNKLELLAANPKNGASRIIVSEEQKTFVAGLDFIIGNWKKQCTLLKKSNSFIWISERDGWKHFYLYGLDGKLIRRLTTGNFPVKSITKIDENEGWIYFSANAEKDVYDSNLYRVDFKGKNFRKLTDAKGYHNFAQFSPSGNYFIDTYSGLDQPYTFELRTKEGKLLQLLNKSDISKIKAIGFNPPESFVVKAADGTTDLYGIMYKPFDFDPNKKYPVIESIYAGPFMTVVPHGFVPTTGASLKAQAMAQLGYISILIDTRGTTERSKKFQDAVYGNIGKYEIEDRVAAYQQLSQKYPFMDMKRVGIYGHSWGGYFAIRALLMAPDLYRVGIASAPGDLTEGAEINEPYMGFPKDNKTGYEFGTNTNHADKLKGKLLFIHGTSDTNAPFSTTVRMIDALIKSGKPYDLLLLPGRNHNLDGEKYANDVICRYFEENLKNLKE